MSHIARHFSTTYFIYFGILFIDLAAPGLSCDMQDLLVAAQSWDLVPPPGIEPRPTVLGMQSLSHGTTREDPAILILNPHFFHRYWSSDMYQIHNQACPHWLLSHGWFLLEPEKRPPITVVLFKIITYLLCFWLCWVFIVVHSLLILVTSLVAEHRLSVHGLQ